MDKIVTFPTQTLDVVNEVGKPTGKSVNTYLHFLGIVIETAPQKNDTDTFIAHGIRQKIDALKPNAKSMVLTDPEILFVQQGVESLRGQGRVAGSGWYYLIDPIRSAKPAGKEK